MKLFNIIPLLASLVVSANALGFSIQAVSENPPAEACAEDFLEKLTLDFIREVPAIYELNASLNEKHGGGRNLVSAWCLKHCIGFPPGQCHWTYPSCYPLRRRNLSDGYQDLQGQDNGQDKKTKVTEDRSLMCANAIIAFEKGMEKLAKDEKHISTECKAALMSEKVFTCFMETMNEE